MNFNWLENNLIPQVLWVLLFSIKHISDMNGNTRATAEDFSQTTISIVQISSLGFRDTHFKVGYLQVFSVIRGLSPTRKSEKRVFLEMVWTSVVLLLNCTHRVPQ